MIWFESDFDDGVEGGNDDPDRPRECDRDADGESEPADFEPWGR